MTTDTDTSADPEYMLADYGEGWFGLKRADWDQRLHAIPEGPRDQWLALLAVISDDAVVDGVVAGSFDSTRLAAAATGDAVMLWSPRNAGQMKHPAERDYLVVARDWLHDEIRRVVGTPATVGLRSDAEQGPAVVTSEAQPHEPVDPGTNRRHTWDQFSESGMLWLANRMLHVFGWCIVVAKDEAGNFVEAYPVRTEWRGFPRDREDVGYTRVSEWMAKAAESLCEETGR